MTNGNDSINTILENGWTRSDGKGLTKREYFAAMAMQAIWSNKDIVDMSEKLVAGRKYGYDFGKDIIAALSVQAADALISELNKTTV